MGLPKTCSQVSAPVAKSGAVIPHFLSPPQLQTTLTSVSLLTVTVIFFPSRKSRVTYRFWGAAAHGDGSSTLAFNGNSLLRSHRAERGQGGGF